jgi:hypothetical protein
MEGSVMQGGISVWHWLIVFVPLFVVIGVPIARILKRAGLSPWWVIVYFVPLLNLAGLWVFAFSRWPALERAADTGQVQP